LKEQINRKIDSVPRQGKVQIPQHIVGHIWAENTEFILEKHVFDPEYFKFVWNVVNLFTFSHKKKQKTELNQKDTKSHEHVL
jgi:hypothetical protein